MSSPGRTAIGTWSGGRFLRFGEAIPEERLEALLRPDEGISTMLSADAYGQGEADELLGRALTGVPREDYTPGGRDRPRLLRGRARRAARLPPLHRPGPARARHLCRLPAGRRRAQPRPPRRLLLRPASAPQPRPRRLHQRGGLGRDGGAARGGHRCRDRRRPGAGQRLHPRPDLLLRAVRRADRLGDDHPQPVRALAGRALPRGRRPPRRPRDHPGRRLRRPVLGRPRAGDGASRRATTAGSGPPAGSRPASRSSSA